MSVFLSTLVYISRYLTSQQDLVSGICETCPPFSRPQSTMNLLHSLPSGLNRKPINGKLEIPRGNPTPSRSLPISFRKVLFLYPEWIVCRSQSSQLSSKMCSLSLRGYEQPQDEMPAPLIAIHVHNCISVDSIMYVGVE